MSFPSVKPGTEGGAALLVWAASSGSIRTRQDAENFLSAILTGGHEKELMSLYRATLALLGDMSALRLPEPYFSVARIVYQRLKKEYIANSECRCLRTPSGAVATNLTTCPEHGKAPGAKPGFRNLGGLLR